MPDLDDADARSAPSRSGAGSDQPSRRSALRVAAGAGAVGLAATALSRVPAAFADRARPAADAARADNAPVEHTGEPVIVHVRDVAAGEIDVFRGRSQVRLNDKDLAARIIRASR